MAEWHLRTDGRSAEQENLMDTQAQALTPRRGVGAATDAAFSARRHDVTTGRSAKGATTQRVTRRGRAYVVGSWTHDADGAAGWSGAVAVAIEQHAGAFGTDARTIQTVTDELFGDEIEPLLGSDVMSWEDIVDSGFYGRPLDDDDERYWNTPGYSVRADVVSRHIWQPQDADHVLRGTTPPETASWPTRQRLGLGRGRRPGDPVDRVAGPAMLRAVSEPFTAPTLATAIRWDLVAAADDREYRYVGSSLVARPPVKVNRGARARRTTTTATVEDRDALVAAIDALNRGDRAELNVGAYRVTVTRGKSGRYAYTAVTGDETTKAGGIRTPYGTASRLHALTR